jgi:DNA invertase Pin-like site-specific DNA recombinase
LHQQGIDTSTPAGSAFFQMLGVFADDAESVVMRSGTDKAQA